jgi:histidyl-tRNA synthetase
MRDYSPEDMAIRETLVERITRVFRKFGLFPLQTPALEYWDLLTAKSGDEATALTYHLTDRGGRELGLRYDLTAPLSRYVAMNTQLQFPFKRYQIQEVWRAEKPQRGRFREFLQCDFDIIGSDSLRADAEVVAILSDSFQALDISDAVILINSRKALKEVLEAAGCDKDKLDQACRIIDKYDKVGVEGVLDEYRENSFGPEFISGMTEYLEFARLDSPDQEIRISWFSDNVMKAFDEVRNLYRYCMDFGVPGTRLKISPILSRGLDYYTGPVFEVHLESGGIGSLAGGGRYDGLIGYFGDRQIPAVGASLGLDRIIALMKERNVMTDVVYRKGVLVGIFDQSFRSDSQEILVKLRENNIESEILYAEPKLKKQFEYANKHNFRIFCFRGPDELEQKKVVIKNMDTGEQDIVPETELIEQLIKILRDIHG